MRTSKPNLYDLLGVARTAGDDEIRTAWRAKTEGGPGGTGFADFNAAAETLLDPARRAKYDASLDRAAVAAEAKPVVAASPRIRLLTAGVGALVLVLVIAAVVVGVIASGRDDQATRTAVLVQVQSALPAMSYDYQNYDKALANADHYFTPEFRTTYNKTAGVGAKLPDGQPGPVVVSKAAVVMTVKDAAVLAVGDTTASVLVFLDKKFTVNGSPSPRCGPTGICQDRVVVSLKKIGPQWLIDKLDVF